MLIIITSIVSECSIEIINVESEGISIILCLNSLCPVMMLFNEARFVHLYFLLLSVFNIQALYKPTVVSLSFDGRVVVSLVI